MAERLASSMTDDELASTIGDLGPSPDVVTPPADLWRSIATAAAEHDAMAEETVRVPDNVVALRPRWTRPAVVVSAAALVAIAAVGAVLANRDDTSGPQRIAEAELVPLAGGVDGARSVLERVGGTLVLEIDAQLSVGDGEFHELWLLDVAATEPVSLGRYDGPGVYEIPEGLVLDEFPVVDISIEPDDGDAGHSGDSVLRGALDL